jgi:hypothetical protein
MKKLLLSFSAITLFAGLIKAQPDFKLETWAQIYPPLVTAEDPQGWASLNVLTSSLTGSMPKTVFKETTAPYEGLASAKIVTDVVPSSVTIPNPFSPGHTMDTVGLLGVGTVQPSAPYINFGYAYLGRPASLTFASKYTPMTGDSAFVLAYLTKWNGATRDTIASGKYATGATTTSYSVNTITMNYNAGFSSAWADTMMIFASSSIYSHDGAKKGSAFYVDDFNWSGWVSTNDIDGVKNNVSIYPNPASSDISIKCSVAAISVDVMDVTGRKIGNYTMTNNEASVKTSTFAQGIYIYNVIDENNQVINRGKFEVTH